MNNIKLGLIPTRRFCFSVEDAHKYKKLVEKKLSSWNIDFVNIDSITEEGLLIHPQDVQPTVDFMKSQHVDAIFVPHCNFGTEEVVARVGKALGKPLLLWGPRDEAPLEDGQHLRDTQCGLFATSNVLQKYGVKFTYITNCRIDDIVFERGVRCFLGAVAAQKALIGARIGQVSTRPDNFYTVIINEQELLTKFGIEMVPLTLFALEAGVNSLLDTQRVKDEVEDFRKRINFGCLTEESVEKIAALKLFMLDWASRENLSAISFKCHDDMPEHMKIYSCFANGEVTGAGIPVSCETDIHGAISSIMLQAAAGGQPTFFADLTQRHPINDNAELLWHCGNFPMCMKKADAKPYLCGHYNVAPGYPGLGNFEIEATDITVCRFDGLNGKYQLLMGEGKKVSGPYNKGTYTWMEVGNWPLWEEKLIYGPYVHHVAGVSAKAAAALYEACKYIDGLDPDPAQPTAEDIKKYLRGE